MLAETYIHADVQVGRHTDRGMSRQTNVPTDISVRRSDRQPEIVRQADKCTDRHMQAGRSTGELTYKCIGTQTHRRTTNRKADTDKKAYSQA